MIVSWMTTNRCNLKCKHCYQDAEGTEASIDEELTTDEAMVLIEQIAKAGFRIMIFSGGEPLLRPDIFELVAHAAAQGLRPVFGSNGMLITSQVARRLKDAGAAAMGISLDSLDELKHNEFRGDPQAWELTLAGINNCREAGLPFQIHTTIMDWNQAEVLDITDFAVELGAIAHYLFFLIPVGRGKYIAETSLQVLENETLLTRIMEKQQQVSIDLKPTCAPQFVRVARQMGVDTRFSRGCLAGLTYCIISPKGIVRPCAYMLEPAGDLRKESFDSSWENSELFKTLRSQAYEKPCGACDYKDGCGGCRARAAYYHEGDYMAADEYCAHGKQLTASGEKNR
jgi:putative heme d1 biosynthesis radical SAM protein NirJ2